jgi:4,5-dihydroxyphthalate decarboxylase
MPLSIVLGDHGQVQALKSGAVTVPGVDFEFVTLKKMTDAYRQMARTQPWDICEMAPTTYLAARAHGAPIIALPIPMTRRFRHAGVMVPADSPIKTPKDLEGQRVGIRAYTVTAGTWTRGVMINEFGLDPDKVTWVVEEDENVIGQELPPNVERAPQGKSLAQLFVEGDLAGGFAGQAGIGEPEGIEMRDLFPDPEPLEFAWFRKTGIYPIHGMIVVGTEVLAANPDLPRKLFKAFAEAKEIYLKGVMSGEDTSDEAKRYKRLSEVVGDPLPYGYEANRASLEALVLYARQQRFVPQSTTVETEFLHL